MRLVRIGELFSIISEERLKKLEICFNLRRRSVSIFVKLSRSKENKFVKFHTTRKNRKIRKIEKLRKRNVANIYGEKLSDKNVLPRI